MAKSVTDDCFNEDYNSLKTAMEKAGLLPNSGNYSKFSTTVSNVNVNVAARIPTQKVLYVIGGKEYKDEIYQYQIWAEKNGNTIASISGGGEGRLDVTGITSAVKEVLDKYKN